MTVAVEDIKFIKSVVQTDTSLSGGRLGYVEVVSGARHALFPRVTAAQLLSGFVRHRKQFYHNQNADDESAYGVMIFLMRPSNGADFFYLAKGTQTDTLASFARKTDIDTYAATRYARTWMGVGQLNSALLGGEEEVELAMASDDFEFPNDGYLYLSNNTMTGQTIADDVAIGDSVEYDAGTWSKIAKGNDITYPKGWCVGDGEVLTIQETTNQEFLHIAKNEYEDEVIGSGNGSDTDPSLSALTNATNGICRQLGLRPVVTATCGSVSRTVNISETGVASGYCSAGQLNMATGEWTTAITWTTAPDNGTDITVTYCENAWSFDGNVATVALAEQVAGAYDTEDTYGCGCIYEDEVACSFENWVETSGSGTYDEETYPPALYNDGTMEDTITITMTSASNFSASGAYYGSMGTGSVSADFSPVNPDTGQPYFTLAADGWGGTWQAGDTIVCDIHPSAIPVLMCQEIPEESESESNNMLPLGAYTE